MRSMRILQEESGNVLVAIICASFIMMLTFMATAPFSGPTISDELVKVKVANNIMYFQNNLISHLNNAVAIRQTINSAANVNLARCVNDINFDCPPIASNLIVYTPDGTVFLGDPVANSGFTTQGVECSPYGTSACPFRYSVTWTPMCPVAGICATPIIKFNINFQGLTSHLNIHRFNPARFSTTFGLN